MVGKHELPHLLVGDLFAFFVFLVEHTGTHIESGGGGGGANVLEDGLIAVQRATRPIVADLGKQAMFDGIPFRAPRRIVTDRDLQAVGVHQSLL